MILYLFMEVECIGNTQIIPMEETGITQQTIGRILFLFTFVEDVSTVERWTIWKKSSRSSRSKNISSHCVLCPAPTTFFALLLTPECLASLDSLALHELKQTRKQFVSCLSLFPSFFTPHNYREHFLSERLCSNYWIIVIA